MHHVAVPFRDRLFKQISEPFGINTDEQWAKYCNSGAMFVTAYLLILAWQKDYGHAATAPQQQAAAVTAHDVSADLPNAQMQQRLQTCHKQM